MLHCNIRLQKSVTRPEAVPDMEKGADADGTIPMKTVMKKMLEWYACQSSTLMHCFQRNILKLLYSVLPLFVMRSLRKGY